MTKDGYQYQIAYLGIPGSNSYLAAKYYFKNKSMIGCQNIQEVIEKVEQNVSAFAVVPVENSTTGSIIETYDQLINSHLAICGEVVLRIHHHLLGTNNNTDWRSIEICYSHPQAINQCRKIISDLKKVKVEFTSDTASAAKLVSDKNTNSCVAIANKTCVSLYNLKLIKKNIEDNLFNFTRFFVISRKKTVTGNKVSLVFSVIHKPGSLVATLAPLARRNLNLTKIESRPITGKTWEYLFLVDLEIGDNKQHFKQALHEIKESTNFIKILGYYDKGDVYET